jgi:Coenzyme PQQ synthesis protein D (PqqD)
MAEYSISKDILSKTVEEVLVDLQSGTYFGLNAEGTLIWNLLKEGKNQQAILAAMGETFDANENQLREDFEFFISELQEKQWITKAAETF